MENQEELPNIISTCGRGPNTIYTLKKGESIWTVKGKSNVPEDAYRRYRLAMAREGMQKRRAEDAKPQQVTEPEADNIQQDGGPLTGVQSLQDKIVPDQQVADEPAERARNLVTCKVCREAEVQKLIIPCGHLVLCSECLKNWMTQGKAGNCCPICRTEIKDHFGVFMIE